MTLNDVHYGDGLWVAVGGSRAIAYSHNGEDWTYREGTGFGSSETLRRVTYANGLWMASSNNGKVSTKIDPTASGFWEQTATGLPTGSDVRGLVYADGMFRFGASNGALGTSYDGANWSVETLPNSTGTIWDVNFADGLWLAMTTKASYGRYPFVYPNS